MQESTFLLGLLVTQGHLGLRALQEPRASERGGGGILSSFFYFQTYTSIGGCGSLSPTLFRVL